MLLHNIFNVLETLGTKEKEEEKTVHKLFRNKKETFLLFYSIIIFVLMPWQIQTQKKSNDLCGTPLGSFSNFESFKRA